MFKGKKQYIFQTIVIAAAYILLTFIADQFGMAKGIVQIRISDALAVLPYYTPAAIPGLLIGSVIANTMISVAPDPMTGKMVLSTAAQSYVLYCSLSMLAGSIGGYLLRKYKFIVSVPTIIFNTITVPMLFKFVFRYEDSLFKFIATIGVGELISCGLLGTALLLALEDYKDKLFPSMKKNNNEGEGESKEEKADN